VGEDFARTDDRCHASVGCAERGECSATKRPTIIFGRDPSLECAAVTDQDCRLSKQCRTHGLCSRNDRYDVGCGAADAAQCRASVRCATHEECELDGSECVRRWTGCPALIVPGAPIWAAPVDLVWDYDSLRSPWHPGDLEHATLACRFETSVFSPSMVRIAGKCAPGPQLVRGGATFLRPDVAVHAGDAIAVSAQDGLAGRASNSPFVQLRYGGSSPAVATNDDDALECAVVPHELALERSRRELAAVDRDLASSLLEQLDATAPRALSPSLESARVHAGRAALWLGWRDPELAVRVPKLDAAATAWQAKLDAAIQNIVTTGPIHTAHLAIARGDRVCGDALRTRLGSRAQGRTIDAGTCGVELSVDNTGTAPQRLWPHTAAIGELDELAWLRAAHGGEPAMVAPAMLVDLRIGATHSDAESVDLPAGKRAVVLVDGAESGAVLCGRVGLRESYAMRP
jgi:hypothetical protein